MRNTILTLVICLLFAIAMYGAHVKLTGGWRTAIMFLCGAIICTVLGIYLYRLLMTVAILDTLNMLG